jgi:hypothetical protein
MNHSKRRLTYIPAAATDKPRLPRQPKLVFGEKSSRVLACVVLRAVGVVMRWVPAVASLSGFGERCDATPWPD